VRRALVGAVAAFSLCAAGCTSGGGHTPPSPAAASPSGSPSGPASPVTLRFSVYGDEQTVAAYRELASSYTDLHPDVTVKVLASPDAEVAARRLDPAGIAPDVFLVDHGQMPQLVAEERVQPVDELLEKRGVLFGDNYQRLGLEAFSADSALQCMPHDVSPLVVFYNTRLLRPRTLAAPGEDPVTTETGWTWEQFATAARRTSHDGVKGLYIPPDLDSLLPLVRSTGADLVDNDRTPTSLTMSDKDTRAALQQVLALARDPQLSPSRRALARQDALSRFEHGRIAMMLGTRRLVPTLREADGLSFDVFPLPVLGSPRTVTEMTGYCVSATTRHLEQAADFLTYAAGPDGEKITAEVGGIVPANLPALHSDAFTQPGSQPSHVGVFSEALRRADAPPFTAAWPALEQQVQPMLDKMFSDRKVDLDRLLPRMDRRSQAVLSPPGGLPVP
jgi:multiple sugar transport system substrate-binding protein